MPDGIGWTGMVMNDDSRIFLWESCQFDSNNELRFIERTESTAFSSKTPKVPEEGALIVDDEDWDPGWHQKGGKGEDRYIKVSDVLKKTWVGALHSTSGFSNGMQISVNSYANPKVMKYGLEALEQLKKKSQSLSSAGKRSFDPFYLTSYKPDPAQRPVEKNFDGGIDFNSGRLDLQVQNAGGAMKFDFDPAMLKRLEALPGFSPVIISIKPLSSVRDFLGVSK
jgi:hypothetical protein